MYVAELTDDEISKIRIAPSGSVLVYERSFGDEQSLATRITLELGAVTREEHGVPIDDGHDIGSRRKALQTYQKEGVA